MGVVLDAKHKRLFVSTGPGGTVAVISLAGPKLVKEVPVGKRTWGIALSHRPLGRRQATVHRERTVERCLHHRHRELDCHQDRAGGSSGIVTF